MAEEGVSHFCASDVIVLVMGLTGVGKSTFIEKLTGEDVGSGHGLVSATTGLGFYCFQLGDRRVFLVDTPGFDDTRRRDTETFKEIAFFLGQAHESGARLGGILYLHRITDNRVPGVAMRSFELVKKMCGADGARFTILVTTMWSGIPTGSDLYDRATQAECELMTTDEYWGWMAEQGSQTQRWLGTRASALSILTTLLWVFDNNGPALLQIQRELIDEKMDVDDTSAGSALSRHHGATWQRLRQELKAAQDAYRLALDAQDRQTAQKLQTQNMELERQLSMTEAAEQELRDSLELIFKSKTEKYRELFFDTQQEVTELSRQIEELEGDLEALNSQSILQTRIFDDESHFHERARTAAKRPIDRQQLDRFHSEKRRRHLLARKDNEMKAKATEAALIKVKKRKVIKRNILAILGMLGGAATIAAGAATLQIPVVAAGIALFGTAGMKLDLSRTNKKKERNKEWHVDDHTA